MSNGSQVQITLPLDRHQVRLALVGRGWTQAHLAKLLNKSLTAVNLAINHNTYPAITEAIRKTLQIQ